MSNTYTIKKQNKYEEALQSFGRFFHSPLYFDAQLPYFGNIMLKTNSNGTLSIEEDSFDKISGSSVTGKFDTDSRYICIEPEVASVLKMYSPYISPSYLIDDNTQYRMVPTVEDSSILIRAYYSTGGTFDTWNIALGDHPFVADHTFFVSFYGKRI